MYQFLIVAFFIYFANAKFKLMSFDLLYLFIFIFEMEVWH